MPENKAPSYEIVKIDSTSYRIENGGVRSFLFVGNEKSLLIDTGFGGDDSLRAVIRSVTDKPVMLVISHADPDHIGANAEFENAFMHTDEFASYSNENCPPKALTEGDVIDIGGRSFEVIHIPGHTPGSIALLDRACRIIITGDSVSSGPVFMFGETRSLPDYMQSLKKLIDISDSFDTVYPSHGEFPLENSQITENLKAAEKLSAGELEPNEPPFPIPAKMYCFGNASFFY